MPQDEFNPQLGRIRDARRAHAQRHAAVAFRQAGKHGARALRQRGHISSATPKRGMGAGARAAAGLMAPGTRRVIVKARYMRIVGGDLGAARAHMKYIVRDGVTREGTPGRPYDANGDDADAGAFLDRSEKDPHQFRFVVSAEDTRLADLKPFIRDLLSQMEHDLDTKVDWVAVDHFNSRHPHTHIMIRGRDKNGEELVMARDDISHGVRGRAQALITLELGPETEVEQVQKLFNEVGQERLTRLDRSLVARAKDGILVISAAEEADPVQQTLRVGRLKTLERLGLAKERQQGVWALDRGAEGKLRQLGERADKFKMMQCALREVGIERAAVSLALFERGPRKAPLIGKVVGVGLVDEISDRTWVVVNAVDGRVHYAELGRLQAGEMPARGMVVALGGDSLQVKPSPHPMVQVLSPVEIERQAAYDGPTWLDQAILSKWRPDASARGFAAEIDGALAARGRWLVARQLAEAGPAGDIAPKPDMMRRLRQGRDTSVGGRPVAPSQRVLPPRGAGPPDRRCLRPFHNDADRQAGRHPPAGHLHACALETRTRALQGTCCHGHDRADPCHVEPRSGSCTAGKELSGVRLHSHSWTSADLGIASASNAPICRPSPARGRGGRGRATVAPRRSVFRSPSSQPTELLMAQTAFSARQVYDLAPLGSLIRFYDGTPEPPARDRHRRTSLVPSSSIAAIERTGTRVPLNTGSRRLPRAGGAPSRAREHLGGRASAARPPEDSGRPGRKGARSVAYAAQGRSRRGTLPPRGSVRFLIDECLHTSLVDVAQQHGHGAHHVNWLGLSGATARSVSTAMRSSSRATSCRRAVDRPVRLSWRPAA
jgi:type IV secretory pathway VirD2 relaxase